MQRASTEEFGVTKTAELTRLSPSFSLLSQLLDFPVEEVHNSSFLKEVKEDFADLPEKAKLIENIARMQEMKLHDLQEHYVSIFELNKRITLYMTFYKLNSSREQGAVLAKLKMLYEMFGVSLEQAEMTDYLPTMLEFLAFGQFSDEAERADDLSFLFSVLEDGTYELLQNAKAFENEPYIEIIKLTRSILRYCVD